MLFCQPIRATTLKTNPSSRKIAYPPNYAPNTLLKPDDRFPLAIGSGRG
jgi:hypothetical protein